MENIIENQKGKKKTRWWLVVVLIAVFIFLLSLLGRFVFVFDAQTRKPISNALVSFKVQGWSSCSDAGYGRTNFLGLAYVRKGFSIWTCEVNIEANGYKTSKVSSFWKLKGFGPLRLAPLTVEISNVYFQYEKILKDGGPSRTSLSRCVSPEETIYKISESTEVGVLVLFLDINGVQIGAYSISDDMHRFTEGRTIDISKYKCEVLNSNFTNQ
jgi:hypothetical protein